MNIKQYGLTEKDSSKIWTNGLVAGENQQTLVSELIQQLEKLYCGSVAAEFEHLPVSCVMPSTCAVIAIENYSLWSNGHVLPICCVDPTIQISIFFFVFLILIDCLKGFKWFE